MNTILWWLTLCKIWYMDESTPSGLKSALIQYCVCRWKYEIIVGPLIVIQVEMRYLVRREANTQMPMQIVERFARDAWGLSNATSSGEKMQVFRDWSGLK
jgi:hypothetical protein